MDEKTDHFPPDLGKFLNGYNIANYATQPKGWTHVDATVRTARNHPKPNVQR